MKTHFKLCGRYEIKIVNIDLNYEVNAIPLKKTIIIDDREEKLDGSFNMVNKRPLPKGSVANLFISKSFACRYASADNAEYGKVNIYIEISSPE